MNEGTINTMLIGGVLSFLVFAVVLGVLLFTDFCIPLFVIGC